MEMKSLDALADDTQAQVVDILPGSLAPRLVEMGLGKGTIVRVLFRAPFGGPLAIDLGESVVSLRLEEAQQVMIAEDYNG